MVADQLAAALLAGRGEASFRKGVTVSSSPRVVSVGGQDAPVSSFLGSYPGDGKTVLLLVLGSSIVVLGELV